MEKIKNICKVEGCEKQIHSLGYCKRHDMQIRRKGYIYGHPFKTKHGKNEYTVVSNYVEMSVYDKFGDLAGKVLVDLEDVEKCKLFNWCKNGSNYIATKINNKSIRLHRYLLNLSSYFPLVDHANRNKFDNRKANLRICTKSENVCNSGKRKNNTSGYKDVFFKKRNNTWFTITETVNGRAYAGGFNTPEEAALAYNQAALKYHGEFAYQNEVNL